MALDAKNKDNNKPNDKRPIAELSIKESTNFITSLLKEIRQTGKLKLQTSMESGKDYIGISDVVKILHNISVNGKSRIYNVASGYNLTNKDIVDFIMNKRSFELQYQPNLPGIIFPQIDTAKIRNEFSFKSGNINDTLGNMISNYFNN